MFFSELFLAVRDFGRQNSAFDQIMWRNNDPVRNSRCIVLVLQHSLVGITAGTSPDSIRMFKASNLCHWGHHYSMSASYPIDLQVYYLYFTFWKEDFKK